MSILITGADGFIGRHLSQYLLSKGHTVILMSRRVSARHDCWQADLTDTTLDLPEGVDIVIHLAAASPQVGRTLDCYLENNVQGTQNLIDACVGAGIKRFIFASAVDCYMDISSPIVDESNLNGARATKTGSSYGWTKLFCEHLLYQVSNEFQILIMRLPGIIGPGCGDPWIGRVTDKMLGDQCVEFYAPESFFNATLHVDNLCAFLNQQISREWQKECDVVNLACTQPLTIKEILRTIKKWTGSNSRLVEREPQSPPFLLNIEKATDQYGFRPSSVQATIEKFLAALKVCL